MWLKVKNTVLRTYVLSDLNGEEIVGRFYEKELQKTNENEFRVEKVIKRKGNNLYVKWKGHNNSFNSWIEKKTQHKWVNFFQNLDLWWDCKNWIRLI